jgi:hypothetical protein
MPPGFQFDVFLSHSAKDKAVVRPLAERLRADGLKVWFDGRKSGQMTTTPQRLGLAHSRVLMPHVGQSIARTGRSWRPVRSRLWTPVSNERHFISCVSRPQQSAFLQFSYTDCRMLVKAGYVTPDANRKRASDVNLSCCHE